MLGFTRDKDKDLEEYDGSITGTQPAEADETNATEEVAAEADETNATEASSKTQGNTTAYCDSKKESYTKVGKPILSITFSLSEENQFEVNVGTSIGSYTKSKTKAHPVLCEIQDLASGSEVKIEPLKNKGCIAQNLPNVLAPYLTKLNSLLLDQYSLFYDSTKYDEFVRVQSEFLKAPTQKPATKVEEEGEEEQEQEEKQEPQLTPEQEERKLKLNRKVLGVVKDGADKINEDDPDITTKLKQISEQNGIGEVLQKFLIDLYDNDKKTYSEIFPLYLLKQKYKGNEAQQLFMTNNGIITNGNVIFSYLNVNIHDRMISANIGGEFTMWTLKNEYQKALAALNGTQKDEGFIPDKLINEGFPDEGFPQRGGLGNRRTLSKKLFKKRTTRRIRK